MSNRIHVAPVPDAAGPHLPWGKIALGLAGAALLFSPVPPAAIIVWGLLICWLLAERGIR